MTRRVGLKSAACALLFLLVLTLGAVWLGQLTQLPKALSLPYTSQNPNGWTLAEAEDRLSLSRTLEELPGYSGEYVVLRAALNGQSDLTASIDGEEIFSSPAGERTSGLVTFSLPENYAGKTLSLTWVQTNPLPLYPSVTLTTPSQEQTIFFAQAGGKIIPATMSLALALLALGLFCLTGALEKFEWALLLLALGPLSHALYWWAQMPQNTASSPMGLQLLSWSNQAFFWLPALFLVFQTTKKGPWLIAWGALAVMDFGLSPLLVFGYSWISGLPMLLVSFLTRLPILLKLLWIVLILALAVREWKRVNPFFRLYVPPLLMAVAAAVLYGLFTGREMLWYGPQSPLYLLTWFIQGLTLAVSLIRFIQTSAQRNNDLRALSTRMAMAQKQFAVMQESGQTLREQSHNTRHHYAALRGLLLEGQVERAKEYLDDLTAQADRIPSYQYSAHPVVNAILTTALARAKRLDIQVSARVELPERLSIPDGDLCTLLMNLLENALEANEKTPEGAEKWLKVLMYVDGLYLFVGVENTRFAPVEWDESTGICRSTKPEEGHGFGMKAAQAIVRKYGSELLVEISEGAFSVSTALLIKE